MDHNEAIQQMAVEQYLLDELAPDAREAFEEHLFDCRQCALDLRAGVAFVDAAKTQLTPMTEPSPLTAPPVADRLTPSRSAPNPSASAKARREGWLSDSWSSWLRPVFAVPAFAALLLVLGYQNLVTLPGLRSALNQPRLVATAPDFEALRGGAHPVVEADSKRGVVLPVQLPQETGLNGPQSFSVDLYDPQSKLVWSGTVSVPSANDAAEQRFSLEIPASLLRNGSYAIAVSGVGPHGERSATQKYVFDLRLVN